MNQLQIYVASLAHYNAGRLVGQWIDADDADEMSEQIDALLQKWGVEEYAIHDYDGFPSSIVRELGEWPALDKVEMHATALDQHGSAWAAYWSYFGDSTVDSDEDFRERFEGEYDSISDWAEDYAENMGLFCDVPKHLHGYIDLDKWARDQPVAFVCRSGSVFAFFSE